MILVVVGMHPTKPFDRLVKEMDRIAGLPPFEDRVVIQKGCSKYLIVNSISRDYLAVEELEAAMESSEIIVAHAGIGTIIDSQRFQKVIVVMPRRSRFGEAINDHQVETSRIFSDNHNILVANDESELLDSVKRALGMRYDASHVAHSLGQITSYVRSLIDQAESSTQSFGGGPKRKSGNSRSRSK